MEKKIASSDVLDFDNPDLDHDTLAWRCGADVGKTLGYVHVFDGYDLAECPSGLLDIHDVVLTHTGCLGVDRPLKVHNFHAGGNAKVYYRGELDGSDELILDCLALVSCGGSQSNHRLVTWPIFAEHSKDYFLE